MGDESESDAEPTEQLDDRDDASPESDETATPSTDTASDPVDDTTSDDATSNGAADETIDESPLQPEASGDTPDEESGLKPVVTERNGDSDDVDVGDSETPDDDTEDEPFDPADSPALEDSEGGFDDADEAFATPVAETEDDNIPGVFGDDEFGDVETPDDEFTTPDGFDDDLDDGLVGDGPDTDQEMPLADHIEEMVQRLAVVFIIGGGVALAVFGLGEVLQYVPSTVDIINFLWNKHIPGAGLPGNELLRPHIYGPLELILTKLKVAGLVGVVVGLPVFVYESYLFMRPGLYQNERKYYLASVPTSLILAVIGVAFAHFVVLPSIFAYFTSYTEGTAVIAFGLAETFNLILILMGYMAIVFQIPLFIMLAIMMNLVTRRWLEDKRLLFWGAFLGLAFLVSPDPTGMAPIIIAITMVTLFEGTLLLLRWTGN